MPLGEAKLSQIQKSLLDAAYGWRTLTVHITLLWHAMNEKKWTDMSRNDKTCKNMDKRNELITWALGSSWLSLALRSWAPGAEVAAPMASSSQGLRRTAGSSPKLRIWKNGTRKTRKTRKTSKSCGPTFLNSLKSLKIFKSNATRPRTLRRRFKFFCKAASFFPARPRQTDKQLLFASCF